MATQQVPQLGHNSIGRLARATLDWCSSSVCMRTKLILNSPFFPYLPLRSDDSGPSCRLLELLPGTGPIHCTLRHAQLSDKPQYEALSYCWESESKRQVITVNNLPFHVTTNLFAALKRLRDPAHSKALWVDAICINQEDNLERSQQVAIMPQIYESCDQVLVWLGEANSRTKLAFKLLALMAQWSEEVIEDIYTGKHVRFFSDKIRTHPVTRRISLPAAVRAITAVSTRPWFTRTWIVQEIAVAKKARVLCGRYALDWAVIEKSNSVKIGGVSVNFRRLITARREYQEDRKRTLAQCLAQHLSTKASDPRDKLFATYKLASDSAKHQIQVNYNKDVHQVFYEATISCLADTSDLDLLSLGWGCSSEGLQSPERPSWVFQWERNWKKDAYTWDAFAYVGERRGKSFDACKSAPAAIKISPDQGLLTLSGYHVDQVSDVCDYYVDFDTILQAHRAASYFHFKNMMRHIRWSQTYMAWIGKDQHIFTDSAAMRNFWEMCSCNSHRSIHDSKSLINNFIEYEKIAGLFRRFCTIGGHDVALLYKIGNFLLQFAPYMSLRYWNTMILFEQDNSACYSRRMFRTKGGLVGLGPETVQPGDSITFLRGGRVPYALRSCGDDWKLVGETYVHGVMYGENWEQEKCHPIKLR